MKICCKIPENLIVFVENYLHRLACTNKLPQTSYNLVNCIVKLQGIKVAFTAQDWVFTCTLHWLPWWQTRTPPPVGWSPCPGFPRLAGFLPPPWGGAWLAPGWTWCPSESWSPWRSHPEWWYRGPWWISKIQNTKHVHNLKLTSSITTVKSKFVYCLYPWFFKIRITLSLCFLSTRLPPPLQKKKKQERDKI